ncbi:hypothetical protein BD324DRAFT_631685 [Kockovaella imperatae]|uniref:Probable 26S proteasome regulatory subunit p27 n=1 Tax=Kockovaella imperatae TaxID=4999 RepID=A0A1Y1UE53_9TREE|nr:hypothetical protein BD324DRAFT_631685 [Kockovaella imperatae]ORX35786.1 hypothetical protein BD324DRAFT_631685 [Kockovaella imperatae]
MARLKTDLKTVQDLLGPALENAFTTGTNMSGGPLSASNPVPNGSASSNAHRPNHQTTDDMPDEWPDTPLARVNSVAPGSPAFRAGLQSRDVIYSFGNVTQATTGGLQAVGTLVAQSEGQTLTVLVERKSNSSSDEHQPQRLRLRLTPQSGWGGRGSLGCHIVPV